MRLIFTSFSKFFLARKTALVLAFGLGIGLAQAANVNSVMNGNWTTGATWSLGSTPNTGADNIVVDHNVTVNSNITLGGSATMMVNGTLIDAPGGTAYNLTVSISSQMTVNGNVTFEGALVVQNNATLTINSGDTLRVGSASLTNNSVLVINAGGVLIVYGNMSANNNNASTVNGKIIVNGDLTASNNASFAGSGSVSATGTISTSNSASFFGSQGSCTNCGVSASSPLPVELLYFSAASMNRHARLSWATATETNNHHFEIERSANGLDFTKIAEVAARGSGTSLLQQQYEYIDQEPVSGVSYYRLRQVDRNGAFEIFQIVSVNFIQDKNITFAVRPNPNKGEFTVDFSGIENNHEVEIILTDAQGKLVYTHAFYAGQDLTSVNIIPESKISNGVYFCSLVMQEIKYTVKVLVN